MAVQIRLATARDGEAVAAIYQPVVAETAISFETTPPDRDEMARRIEETLRSYDFATVSSQPGWTELLKLGEPVIRAEAA